MTGTKRIAIAAALFLLAAFSTVQADGVYDLLRNDVSPRGAALGGFPVAIADGQVTAAFQNPGALTTATRQATAAYADHPLDLSAGMGFYGQPFYKGYAAVGMTYFNYGEFDQYTSVSSPASGTFSASDMVLSLSYAQPIWRGLSGGVTAKYIRGEISDYTSSGAAMDLGLYYDPNWDGVTIGATVQNIGAQLEAYNDTKEDLPLIARFGVSNKLEHLPLRITATAHYEQNEDIFFTGAGEFTVSELLQLRAGYTTLGSDYRNGGSDDSLAGLSAGLGLTWRGYGFDYAFLSQGALGQVHRFGVRAVF